MDNNNEKTDRFFRERLSVYEEMPADQVWDKIASRLETEKRRKAIFLFLRIAAGMTLLFSLGLGYHLINRSDDQKAVITKQPGTEKPGIASSEEKNSNKPEFQSQDNSGKSVDKIAKSATPYNKNTYIHNTTTSSGNTIASSQSRFNASSGKNSQALASMKMHESSLLAVNAPHRLGYRRLSQEEMQEQTAALTMEENENLTEDEMTDRWMLGSEVAPLYSYRNIESDYLDNSTIQDMNSSEKGLLAYAGGLRVGYKAGRRLSVQSGLYYSRYGQENNNVETISVDQRVYMEKDDVTYLSIPNSTGTIQANKANEARYEKVLSSPNGNAADFYTNNSGFPALNEADLEITEEGITAVQYFDYLELPVTVKYKIIDRKFSFSFLGGVITNFLVNNTVQLKQDGNSETFGTTRDINKVNYQGSVGLGFDYPLMDRLSISLEPRFRYYLNPIDQRFDVHPYSFGIFAGISYSLR